MFSGDEGCRLSPSRGDALRPREEAEQNSERQKPHCTSGVSIATSLPPLPRRDERCRDTAMNEYRFCIAPMMEWTLRFDRALTNLWKITCTVNELCRKLD